MVSLNVNFENPDKFYMEGEKLSAKVEVSVEEPVNASSILVYFVGECCCSSDADFQMKPKSNQKGEKETYFNDVLQLFVATDEEESSFSKGVHSFNVEYQLPTNLPTSLESPQGYVRYSLHASADIGGSILKATHYFTVLSKSDLSNNAVANLPVVLWRNENQCIFSLICFGNGPVRICVHIPKRGYIPGESVQINAEVKNFYRLPINWVKASLIQILKYNSLKISKRKRVVAEITRGCILSHDSQSWRSESLSIPALPPTTNPPKGMINVKYKLYFMVKTSWQEKAISLKQNLLIGTAPLMEGKPAEERGQGEGEGMVNNCSYQYTNLEPCIFGPYSIGEDNIHCSFSPLYPKYVEFWDT